MQRKSGKKEKVPAAGRPFMPGYDMMFNEGRSLLSWVWAERRLKDSHNYWLVSSWPSGRPHVMPIWGVWFDFSFFFSTGKRSRKFRNLEASPNCVVCPEGAAQAVILEGIARKLSNPSLRRQFNKVYRKKYDYEMEDTKDPIYRVLPEVIFGIAENGKGNPTRWRFQNARMH